MTPNVPRPDLHSHRATLPLRASAAAVRARSSMLPLRFEGHKRNAPTGVQPAPRRDHAAMPLRAGLHTLLIVALGAAPAGAAFDVTAFEVTPSTTAAGAHADVTIATSFSPITV